MSSDEVFFSRRDDGRRRTSARCSPGGTTVDDVHRRVDRRGVPPPLPPRSFSSGPSWAGRAGGEAPWGRPGQAPPARTGQPDDDESIPLVGARGAARSAEVVAAGQASGNKPNVWGSVVPPGRVPPEDILRSPGDGPTEEVLVSVDQPVLDERKSAESSKISSRKSVRDEEPFHVKHRPCPPGRWDPEWTDLILDPVVPADRVAPQRPRGRPPKSSAAPVDTPHPSTTTTRLPPRSFSSGPSWAGRAGGEGPPAPRTGQPDDDVVEIMSVSGPFPRGIKARFTPGICVEQGPPRGRAAPTVRKTMGAKSSGRAATKERAAGGGPRAGTKERGGGGRREVGRSSVGQRQGVVGKSGEGGVAGGREEVGWRPRSTAPQEDRRKRTATAS